MGDYRPNHKWQKYTLKCTRKVFYIPMQKCSNIKIGEGFGLVKWYVIDTKDMINIQKD
jgi:hypothetical protein